MDKKYNGKGNIYGKNIEKIELTQYIYVNKEKEYITFRYSKYLEGLINEIVELEKAVNHLTEDEATRKWRGKLKALYGDGHYLKIPVERYEGAKVYLNSEIEKLQKELREKIYNEVKDVFFTKDLIEIYKYIEKKIIPF